MPLVRHTLPARISELHKMALARRTPFTDTGNHILRGKMGAGARELGTRVRLKRSRSGLVSSHCALDAAVRDQPHQGDQDVDCVGYPHIEKGEADTGDVEQW